jgi:MYXO-CTERM domain-containing protein
MSAVRLSSLLAAAAVLVTVSLARPRPCAAQLTGAARNVTLKMTIPDGVTKIRGVFAFTVRGLASGWASNAAFQGLAKRLNSVIVMVSGGDDLNDGSYPGRCASGEFNGIGEALDKLAMSSNHPELAHAPIVGLGHSHGGDYWNWYNACHPERMAAVFVHASGGVNYSAASLKVPVFYTLGTADLIERGSGKPRAGMFANRAKGAPMTLVIGVGGHDTQFSAEEYTIVTEILEAIFNMRVPAEADGAKGPVPLYDIVEGPNTWLGDLYDKNNIAAYPDYKGDKALTAFLPNAELAMKWKTNGPALPKTVTLPTSGPCGWCGNPKDEPKGTGMNPPPPMQDAPDAGAAPPADADTTSPPTSVADAGSTGGGGSPPTVKKDAGAPATTEPPPGEDPPADPPKRQPSGGCNVAGAGSGLPFLMLAALAYWRRRRR